MEETLFGDTLHIAIVSVLSLYEPTLETYDE